MSLNQILLLSTVSILLSCIPALRWRIRVILILSFASIYWLQPALTIRQLDFWLPTIAVGVSLATWAAASGKDPGRRQPNLITIATVSLTFLLISGLRYIDSLCCLTATRPPGFPAAFISLSILSIIIFLIHHAPRTSSKFLIFVILLMFIGLKYPPLTQKLSETLRTVTGQEPSLASALEIQWLGFSYIAFRLIHVLREYQTGRLQSVSLSGLITYTLFFPTLIAGPIDRYPRFQSDLEKESQPLLKNIVPGAQRILLGLFKKFALADSLALIALNPLNALQTNNTPWLWVLLYAYSLRIYLDFSGYTDIAIGLGRIIGFTLPENFRAPYLKTDLAAFWNSWHITLAQWFRAYIFNPLTRFLRSQPDKFPVWLIILSGQFSTMGLIGLWHGITWNFLIWGLWHASGLFIHNRWSEWRRAQAGKDPINRLPKSLVKLTGWALTFHYVTLGWVWFALPDPSTAWSIFKRLLIFG